MPTAPVGLPLQASDGVVTPNRDMVRMKLLSDKSQRIKFQQRWYIIEPGREALVPWNLMVCIAGNPFATDTGNRKDRTEELRRLRNLWGIYHDDEAWKARPVIQFTDLDDNILPTPLWDPEESTGSVMEAAGVTADNKFLMNQIDKLQAQISQMSEMMEQREKSEAAHARSQMADPNPAPDAPYAGPEDGTVTPRPVPQPAPPEPPDVIQDVTEDTGRPKTRAKA